MGQDVAAQVQGLPESAEVAAFVAGPRDARVPGVIAQLPVQAGVLPRLDHGAETDAARRGGPAAVGGAAHVEHGNDVGVVETGSGAGLGQISVGVLGAGDEVRVRHLDRHLALELFVAGQVDPAEAALAEQPLDAVTADVRREIVSRRRRGDRLAVLLRYGPEGIVHGEPRGWANAVVCVPG
jgi:hypothetical protein